MKRNEKQLAEVLVDQLADVSGKELEQAAADLVKLCAERNQLERVKGVMRAIDAVWAKKFGAATIHVTTAYPLEKSMRAKLEKIAQGAEIRENVDVDLIGGATLRIDEKIIDGSIKGHLDQLAQAFANV